MIPANFRGVAKPLTQDDINNEASVLQCPVALVHAFSDLESGGTSGFLTTGQPKMLFEAHTFSRLTSGQYDEEYPNISSPTWDRSLYGAGGLHQYDRLNQAMSLDESAALEAASWGKYQVMGMNYHLVGFSTPQDMVAAMCDDEFNHLKAFGNFCVGSHIDRFMRSDPPDFVRLAVGYNGAGEAANGYDQKLRAAFNHYVAMGEGTIPSTVVSHTETCAPSPLTDQEKIEHASLLIAAMRAKLTNALAGHNVDMPPVDVMPPPFDVLRPGDRGAAVLWLQQKLRDWWLPVTGIYDQTTADAVVYLEECENIGVDEGIAGPKVRGVLIG